MLLPTVLTLWILVKAYEFIDGAIAQPINGGIRIVIDKATPHVEMLDLNFQPTDAAVDAEFARREAAGLINQTDPKVRHDLRVQAIDAWWHARWYMNYIGIIVAILAVYIAGRLLGGFLGRRLYARLEGLLTSIPLVKQVYPYVKQVVDFLISDDKPIQFNRVVMVEYPRRGIWSIGLVTGTPMRVVQEHVKPKEGPTITVFIPSSPTPFTGYTIAVPKDSVIELPITIDEALRFTISGGVLVPDHQTVGINDPLADATPLSKGVGHGDPRPSTGEKE